MTSLHLQHWSIWEFGIGCFPGTSSLKRLEEYFLTASRGFLAAQFCSWRLRVQHGSSKDYLWLKYDWRSRCTACFLFFLGCVLNFICSISMCAVLLHWWGNLSKIHSCWFELETLSTAFNISKQIKVAYQTSTTSLLLFEWFLCFYSLKLCIAGNNRWS